MNKNWLAVSEKKLSLCDNEKSLRDVINSITSELRLPLWFVGIQASYSLYSPSLYSINNYSDEWWVDYINENWVVSDPFVRYAINYENPRFWDLDGWCGLPGHKWSSENEKTLEYFRFVERFGVRSGLFIPFHLGDGTITGVNLPYPAPIEISYDVLSEARIWFYAVIPQLVSVARKILRNTDSNTNVNLTPREKEVLLWVGEGLTSKGIADLLGISFRTIEHYLVDIQRKLGVTNRQQAVARAVNMGIITHDASSIWVTSSFPASGKKYVTPEEFKISKK